MAELLRLTVDVANAVGSFILGQPIGAALMTALGPILIGGLVWLCIRQIIGKETTFVKGSERAAGFVLCSSLRAAGWLARVLIRWVLGAGPADNRRKVKR